MKFTKTIRQNLKTEIATNTDEKYSCGVAFFKVKGKISTAIGDTLWKEHKIKVPVIENYENHYVDYGNVNVIGVATPVFVTTRQLNTFIQAVEKNI